MADTESMKQILIGILLPVILMTKIQEFGIKHRIGFKGWRCHRNLYNLRYK